MSTLTHMSAIDAETVAILREKLFDPPSGAPLTRGETLMLLAALFPVKPADTHEGFARSAFERLAAVVAEYDQLHKASQAPLHNGHEAP